MQTMAQRLVAAVEEHMRRTGDSYADIHRRAGLSRGYLGKIRDAVAADPHHRVDSETMAKIAGAIGMRWELVEA